MIIAVEISSNKDFIYKVFKIIIAEHPQHSFVFIGENLPEDNLMSAENVILVNAGRAKLSLLNEFKISSLLKKYKADVFVTSKIISSTKVPQCLVAPGNSPHGGLKKAKAIIVDSEYSKKQIEEQNIDPSLIVVAHKGFDESSRSFQYDEREIIKASYAEGQEYFLTVFAGESSMLNILKAFSVFKKMQKSSMQLLVIAKEKMTEDFLNKLKLFKYSSDVQVVNDPDVREVTAVTGSAYAFIDPPPGSDHTYVLNAMNSGVPVLGDAGSAVAELCGNAGLYFNGNEHADIGDKMMKIFKDEKLRAQMISEGSKQVQGFSWKNSAVSLWQAIEKACR
jgi:glycosyltransferase involved in cell wall biosynthesis